MVLEFDICCDEVNIEQLSLQKLVEDLRMSTELAKVSEVESWVVTAVSDAYDEDLFENSVVVQQSVLHHLEVVEVCDKSI